MKKDELNRMSKPMIARELAKRLDVNLDVSVSVLEALIDVLIHGIDNYDKVDLCGLLTIEKKFQKERSVVLKGTTFPVPECYVVKAKMCGDFKKMNTSGRYSRDQITKAKTRYKK